MKDVRAIAAILHPNLDLSERTLSTKQIALVINAIRSESITPEEHALGSFTRRELKGLSSWPKWRDGEHKQLDHFHQLQMYELLVAQPQGAIVLRPC